MDSLEIRKEKLLEEIEKSEFIKFLDLEFVEMTDECVVGRIPFVSKFLNPYGTMHGGLLYSLADTVAGSLACLTGQMCTTVDGHLSYLSPAANTEYVYCRANILKNGRQMVHVRAEIYGEDGKIFDDGVFNYFKMS